MFIFNYITSFSSTPKSLAVRSRFLVWENPAISCSVPLTFKGLQKIFAHIPTDGLKVWELKEIWSLQSAFHLITPKMWISSSVPTGTSIIQKGLIKRKHTEKLIQGFT